MEKFISFVESFRNIEPLLIESVLLGYGLCFESFSGDSEIIMRGYYDFIKQFNHIPESGDEFEYMYKIVMNGIPIEIYINSQNGGISRANAEMQIEINNNELHKALDENNLTYAQELVTRPDIRKTIMHELSHLYEFSNRNVELVNKQLKSLSNPEHLYNKNHTYYLNHRAEKLQNAISYLGYSIFELINNGITDKNQLLNNILNAGPIKITGVDGSIHEVEPIAVLNKKLHSKNLSYIKRKLSEFITYITDNKHTSLHQIITDINNIK